MHSILFEPVRIDTIELKNRFVMSAAADNLSGDEGQVTDAQVARYRDLADGGVGLIISGGITVHPTGTSHSGSPTLADDSAIPGWQKLTSEVHGKGAKIAAQLVHSGIWTSRYQNSLGQDGIAPSVLPPACYYLNRGWMSAGRYRAATDDDLAVITAAFGEAARRAKEAGFDAIEVSLGLQGELFAGTGLRTGINTISKEAYYRNWSREIKKAVTLPIMLVGGLRSFELIEEIVENGEADLASLCRPLVQEPRLINDWKGGDRHRAACVSCNLCVKALGEGKPLACYFSGK